jgi:hypothetical protein
MGSWRRRVAMNLMLERDARSIQAALLRIRLVER